MKQRLKGVLIVVLVVVGFLATTATSGSDSKGSSDSDGSKQQVYKIGQPAHTGDFDVTLETVKNPYAPTNELEKPSPGKHFVATELTVKNTASEQKTISTILDAEVADSKGQHFNVALAGTDLPQLGGSVPANDIRRGWMVFEVPDDSTGLQLRLKGDITSNGSLFALS